MSLTKRIYKLHRDELLAVQETPIIQKLRVSIEKRMVNIEALVREATPDTWERSIALSELKHARQLLGKMLDKMDAITDEIPF